MIFEQSLEVLLSIRAEQEAIDPRSKLLEGEVGGGKDCTARMCRGIVKSFKKTGFCQGQLKGAELSREKRDDFSGLWWRDKNAVNAVNDTIGTKL